MIQKYDHVFREMDNLVNTSLVEVAKKNFHPLSSHPSLKELPLKPGFEEKFQAKKYGKFEFD